MRVLQRVLINLNRLVKLIVAIAIIHTMDCNALSKGRPSCTWRDTFCKGSTDRLRSDDGRLPLTKRFLPIAQIQQLLENAGFSRFDKLVLVTDGKEPSSWGRMQAIFERSRRKDHMADCVGSTWTYPDAYFCDCGKRPPTLTRAGFPTAVLPAGTSRVTTLPAPMTA